MWLQSATFEWQLDGATLTSVGNPLADGQWHHFWSAPFTVTAEQLRDFPNLRLLTANAAEIEIRNVRIMAYQ